MDWGHSVITSLGFAIPPGSLAPKSAGLIHQVRRIILCNAVLDVLFMILLLTAPGAYALQTSGPASWLREAKQALTGEQKDTEKSRKLLLQIVGSPVNASSEERVWAHIYLGYIEDREGKRQAAIEWYGKALKIQGASSGSASLARFGLQQRLVWIRHLDAPEAENETKQQSQVRRAEHSGRPQSYVVSDPPAGITLATNLSEHERRENFEILWKVIDVNYAHFKLKSIDWDDVRQRYSARLTTIRTDDDFYLMMFQLVNELKDTHSWLQNYKLPPLPDASGVAIEGFQGKPFVISGEKAGWEVLSINGLPPAQKVEALKPYLHACSSERAFARTAYRFLLAGNDGETANVDLRAPDGHRETVAWKRTAGHGHRPPELGLPAFVTKQRYVNFGRYPSGLGYVQIETFNGREEIDQEFDRALEALRDTSGLILDIRNNAGGFGHPQIAGRFFKKRTRAGFSYTKNGSRHTDFERREIFVNPSGKWQYTRPVALLVNDDTGSASDLFATELRAARQVITIGATTHGNLSGIATYAVLPCGLVVRISNGYITDAHGRPIEMYGNVPDIVIEPAPQDYLSGKDPVLDRAVEVLGKKLGDVHHGPDCLPALPAKTYERAA